MTASGQNRRYEIRLANDRFLIRKRTFCATASNDGTWPFPAAQAMKSIRGRPTATCDPLPPFELGRSNVCFWKIEQLTSVAARLRSRRLRPNSFQRLCRGPTPVHVRILRRFPQGGHRRLCVRPDANQPTENAMPSKATSHPSASRARTSSLSLSSAGFVLLMWMKMRRSMESPRSASMEPSEPDMDMCPMR